MRNFLPICLALLGAFGCAAPTDLAATSPETQAYVDGLPAGETPATVSAVEAITVDGETIVADGPTLSLVFLPEGSDTLVVRDVPSADGEVVGELDSFYLDIPSTGESTRVHGVTWLEVVTPDLHVGWAPAEYLTEYVPGHDFCEGTGAWDLLTELSLSLTEENGDRMLGAISPTHGVSVRYIRTGEPVHLDAHTAGTALEGAQMYSWGFDPATGEEITVSFADVAADLSTTLQNGETHCERLVTGAATYDATPDAGLRFFSIHLPATDDAGLDWVTWNVGVVYVEGMPYVASLERFGWEG